MITKTSRAASGHPLVINIFLAITVIIYTVQAIPYTALALEKSTFRGTIVNAGGKAVNGAEIFIYNSFNTRKPADFISARSDINGKFSITVPPGRYWALARLRHGEKYGPLMAGDKHSGEPVEIELGPGEDLDHDFSVVDIKEAVKLSKKTGTPHLKLTGKVIDKRGVAVQDVYVFANRKNVMPEVPDYLSGWTGIEGEYTLFLPAGDYYIGYAAEFPPGIQYMILNEINVGSDRDNFDITVHPLKKAEPAK